MSATTPLEQVKHWTDQIAAFEDKIRVQEGRVAEAQKAASEAAFAGKDTEGAVRKVAHARDTLDALKAAQGEARRHLEQAKANVAEEARANAHKRAQKLTQDRLDTAEKLDDLIVDLADLFDQWTLQGAQLSQEMAKAGLKTPSNEGRGYRVRAAAWALAPDFMDTIEARRVNQEHRVPFRETTLAQAGPVLSGET